jgi:glycosyltransferase involved in cell wall biosynthesis
VSLPTAEGTDFGSFARELRAGSGRRRGLRIGFHYHLGLLHGEGGPRAPAYFGRFLESLCEECDELVCFLHRARQDEVPHATYVLKAPNLVWVDLGERTSVPRRLLAASRILRPVVAWRSRLDALLMRGPSPLLPQIARIVEPVPTALLLVGDYTSGPAGLDQPRWRRRAIQLWAYWNRHQQLAIARRSITFVNSRKLFSELQDKVPNLVETRTTTLYERDLFFRSDTCSGPRPIRVLYPGRIDREKGLLHVVEAVGKLVARGYDVVFDVVGWAAPGDTTPDDMQRLAQRLGIEKRLVFHGFKSVGPELFALYRSADLHVIASINSEGQPRTVWEALAHGVPVVASRIGSMPLFLEHERTALLVAPGSAAEIASAVARIIDDAELRRRLIREGYELARSNTLERRTRELVTHIESWLAAGSSVSNEV